MDDDLSTNPYDRATALQNLLISEATGSPADNGAYRQLRSEFMNAPQTKDLVPSFVRADRDLDAFWGWIKYEFKTYAERRAFIREQFGALLDRLEGRQGAPLDNTVTGVLASFDVEGVHASWEKALQRRETDPAGAITMARTLVEAACKRVLDNEQVAYDEKDDLPVLYRKVAEILVLSPSQHTEETFKAILGSCHQIVERLGTLRNRIGDAHAQGGAPVKPAPRHAALAVNLAGTMATFIVETWEARKAASTIARPKGP